MFTGLIEELGIIVDLKGKGTSLCLKIEAERVFGGSSAEPKILQNGLKIGDSVAVNGVCLTATAVQPPYFEVTAVQETLAKTTLGSLKVGRDERSSRVNLELAAKLETRLGGHLVQGHVDGVARVAKIEEVDGSWEVYIELPPNGERYVVPQGSIAIDGISLTVAQIVENGQRITDSEKQIPSLSTIHSPLSTIKLAIIPHTYYHTTIQYLKTSDRVNVEFDVIAKMVERLVRPYSR